MIDYLLLTYVLFGILSGVIVGLIPGIGNTFVLILLFPFLLKIDPFYLIVFSMSMLSISQYMGSVTCIIFSAPGESSSMPALYEGHRMYQDKQGSLALSGCAIGSTVGSVIALFFTIFFLSSLDSYAIFYSTKIQFYILLTILIFLVFNKLNHWFVNIIMIMSGYALGIIGVNSIDLSKSITFGIDKLISGIPMFPVLFCLFIFPQIINSWKNNNFKPSQKNLLIEYKLVDHLNMFIKNYSSAIRGTIIGYFMGLVPYLTTIAASNVSYSIESWLQKYKKKYNKKGDYASLISAETANNAAAFSSFLPLLAIGIPITPSEAIIANLSILNGYVFSIENFMNIFTTLAICLVLVNFIGLIISWPLVKNIKNFNHLNFNYVYPILIFISLIIIIYIGSQSNLMLYYIIISSLLLPIGYLIRNYNTIPLVFVFLLQSSIEENFIRYIYYL